MTYPNNIKLHAIDQYIKASRSPLLVTSHKIIIDNQEVCVINLVYTDGEHEELAARYYYTSNWELIRSEGDAKDYG